MYCPKCGGKARVLDSRSHSGGRTCRKRRCDDCDHDFATIEELVGWRLDHDVHLRHSGDRQQVQTSPFQPDRLLREVREGVIGRLTEKQITDVVDAAIARLRYEIVPKKAQELTGAELERVRRVAKIRHPIAFIWDSDVREAIECELWKKETHRTAHVLYAMAFIGRADRERSKGWTCAEDVLKWMFGDEAYPDLREPIPERTPVKIYKWRPTKPENVPEQVRKRDGALVKYVDRRFLQSIQYAMLGRPKADTVSQWVSWWVLHDLQGQPRIHSAQLAVGVLDCLRRVDDIAYLRWATQLKNFRAVQEIKSEALALITHPSDGLIFDPEASPRKPISVLE